MKYAILTLILLFLAIGLFYFLSTKSVKNTFSVPIPVIYADANKLSSLVNDWRYENNLKPFTKNEFLCGLAEQRSIDIQTSPTHDKFFQDVASLSGQISFGENLVEHAITEQAVLDAWLNSPEHRKNLEDTRFTQMCIICQNNYCAQELSSTF
jgi:uncharacterized protein YkwD